MAPSARMTGVSVPGAPIRYDLETMPSTLPSSRLALQVSLQRVGREFDGQPAVDAIDLEIQPGEFTALLGPSGCGKTTLLRLIAGLDRPTSGEVVLRGGEPDHGSRQASRRDISYVFQEPHLMPWRDVSGNVELPLELCGVSRADRRDRALRAIEQVGLADAANRHPSQLSGGMRMRASLARALVAGPSLLLLDEPFAALDEITRQSLESDLRALWLERRMTVIFVTHSIHEAVFLAERAVVLSRRPARKLLDHRIALPVDRPEEIRTEDAFVREMRRLHDALRSGGT
jgi:NitT/TauT family transport system ATP-binding protein